MPSLGPPLVMLAFLAIAFAGCIEEGLMPARGPDGRALVPADDYEVPDLVKMDAAKFLVGHKKFVTTYPYRANNAEGHVGARDALAQEFTDMGLILWRQKFTTGIPQENICGIKIGVVEPRSWVVVGGHYDTTTWDDVQGDSPGSKLSQGAYDDGSGTWITIELARAYADIDSAYSIVFCAFDGEERGLQGSAAVKRAMGDGGDFPYEVDSTHAMLDLDMFGINWPTRAPIYVTQNNKVLLDKIQEKRKAMGIPDDMFKEKGLVPALGSSDYGHWIRDTPTVFYISDFNECGVPTPVPSPAPTPGVPCSYPWWHWIDTIETMTAMAGGPDMSRAGFQTALELSAYTLHLMAYQPELVLAAPA